MASCECVLFAFSLIIFILLFDNPVWEAWENGFSGRIKVKSPPVKIKGIEDWKLNPLQSFPSRGYHSHLLSCSNIHQLSSTLLLECEGVNTSSTCGGIPLIPGLCVLPEKVEYVSDSDTHSAFDQCSSVFDNFEFGSFSSIGVYHSSPSTCELADLNPNWLHTKFYGKRILFVGDSHARNLFTSFVSEVRNQRYVVERHPDQFTKDNLRPFQLFTFNATHDHLQEGSKSDEEVLPFCEEKEDNCPVQVMYLWAGFAQEYHVVLETRLKRFQPSVIISGFLGKAYVSGPEANFDKDMQSTRVAFQSYFSLHPQTHFIAVPFPLHGGERVVEWVAKWFLEENVQRKPFLLLLRQSQFMASFERSGGVLHQLKRMSHSVCALYDTYSLVPEMRAKDPGGTKIVGFESCTAPIDRALVRAAISFAAMSK